MLVFSARAATGVPEKEVQSPHIVKGDEATNRPKDVFSSSSSVAAMITLSTGRWAQGSNNLPGSRLPLGTVPQTLHCSLADAELARCTLLSHFHRIPVSKCNDPTNLTTSGFVGSSNQGLPLGGSGNVSAVDSANFLAPYLNKCGKYLNPTRLVLS